MHPEVALLTKPVRWGIISSASIGISVVAPAILASSNGQLVAVGSRNPQRARELFAFAPGVRFSHYESLIKDTDIEAIYNPLPNSLHAEWTIKALHAGKHVLCEKPLAVSVKQGKAMAGASYANGVLLMEAFAYRFHPQMLWVLEQVGSGRIGKVKLVRSSFSFDIRPRPHDIRLQPALAGGSLMDVGCYLVNFCRAIYGHAALSVSARIHVPAEGHVERAVNAILDFGEGRFGLIDTSFELPLRQAAEIIGEAGTITLPMPFPPKNVETVISLSSGRQTLRQRFAPVDHYQFEVEHFANCLRSEQQPVLSLTETLENLATMDAIYRDAGYPWPMINAPD